MQNVIYVNLLHLKQASYQLTLVRWDQLIACDQSKVTYKTALAYELSIMFPDL